MKLKNKSHLNKIIILAILFNTLSSCIFENSNQSKIEALVVEFP